jgi:hypothetical protein
MKEQEQIYLLLEEVCHAEGEAQIRLFIAYCMQLIAYKEKNVYTEEGVGRNIVNAMRCEHLKESPLCDAIFDISSELEKSRYTSYTQSIGNWDARTADIHKHKEWSELLKAIAYAQKQISAV